MDTNQSTETMQADARGDDTVAQVEWVEPAESFGRFTRDSLWRALRTGGFSYFWDRAEGRRRIYECVRVNGKPLVWTGTGREILMAFLAVVGVLSAMVAAIVIIKLFYAHPPKVKSVKIYRLFITLPTLFLIGAMVWRRLAHDMARTRFAGSAFKLVGRPWSYAWLNFWTAFLIPLTLGWIIPWRTNELHRRKVRSIAHGDQHFEFAGSVKPLYRRFAVVWAGGIVIYLSTMVVLGLTIGKEIMEIKLNGRWSVLLQPDVALTGLAVLGSGLLFFAIVASWYRAAAFSHFVSSIRFGRTKLQLELPEGQFMMQSVSNTLMKLFSFGILGPYADARHARLVISHVSTGAINAVANSSYASANPSVPRASWASNEITAQPNLT